MASVFEGAVTPWWFLVTVLAVSVVSAAAASVVGFGIGSLLTPLVAVRLGVPLAVAVVALPHAVASLVRVARLRESVDWSVLRRFGLLSAAGALAGARCITRAWAGARSPRSSAVCCCSRRRRA